MFDRAFGEGELPLRALGQYLALHYHFVSYALRSFGLFYTRFYHLQDVRKMMASGDFVSMLVRYHHVRGDEVFDQDGIELFRLDGGKIKEFWAYIRDSRAFDEFFR